MARDETNQTGEIERVGYGCPPAEHQFPNNPKRQVGRKKGSKNKPKLPPDLTESEAIALDEAKRMVGTTQGPMETTKAVSRAQVKTAMNGGTNAQKAVLARIDAIQRKQREAEDARLACCEEYVQRGEELLDRATPEQRADLDRWLLPHPLDVEVDFDKRKVLVHGPASTRERREWDRLKADLADLRAEIVIMREELERSPYDHKKQHAFFYLNERFEEICEILPERHRPAPVKDWTKIKAVQLLFNRARRRHRQESRRLETDPAYLEEYIARVASKGHGIDRQA